MNKESLLFDFSLNELINTAGENGIEPVVIFNMLHPNVHQNNSLADVNHRLISSIANRSMMANVIGFYRKTGKNDKNKVIREKEFDALLFNFDVSKILLEYDWKQLFRKFQDSTAFRIHKEQNYLWQLFAKGILSGAKFLSEFSSKSEFNDFVIQLAEKKELRLALPLYISEEVEGMGFTLACDFLKELGYKQYPKPDVHIRDYFEVIESKKYSDYELCKRVIQFVEDLQPCEDFKIKIKEKYGIDDFEINCYSFDKIVWLLGSWKFYQINEDPLPKQKTLKKDFLQKLERKVKE